jgi:hypothetical protein
MAKAEVVLPTPPLRLANVIIRIKTKRTSTGANVSDKYYASHTYHKHDVYYNYNTYYTYHTYKAYLILLSLGNKLKSHPRG